MEDLISCREAYTFSDVLIVPKYSEIDSRRNVSLASDFGNFTIDLPIIAANMKTICGPSMAIAMAENGGMGILHRFCTIEQAIQDFLSVKNEFESSGEPVTSSFNSTPGVVLHVSGTMEKPDMHWESGEVHTLNSGLSSTIVSKRIPNGVVGVSIGVQEEDRVRFEKLYESGARIFCIDIAHGHCKLMKETIEWIKSQNLSGVYIIAGNVATVDGAYNLAEWGANAVKVGIGPGAACLTRKNTGVGIPQLYALDIISEDFSKQGIKNVKIIADGGMSSIGDISKSMRFSHAVMLGSMLAGTTETPGTVFTNDKGEFYKVYAGSASGENKVSNGNTNEFIEGVAKTVVFRGHVKHILRHMRHGLQSAFSYVGANNLKEFQEKCEFVWISDGGRKESKI